MSAALKRNQSWWDRWFLGLAEYVSTASKDPSTRTGAVLVDGDRRVVSVGYNGFPRGVEDSEARLGDRKTKYDLTVHCEINAILFSGRAAAGCTVYTWPFGSCTRCAVQVVQAGIVRCVAPVCPPDRVERWGKDLDQARRLLDEAGVVVEWT